MIITRKNYGKYFDKPCYISFPRKRIFATVLFHFILIHIGIIAMYGYLTYIAFPLVVYELFYTVYFVRKPWKSVGYSQGIFFVIIVIKLMADVILSVPERRLLAGFFAVLGG